MSAMQAMATICSLVIFVASCQCEMVFAIVYRYKTGGFSIVSRIFLQKSIPELDGKCAESPNKFWGYGSHGFRMFPATFPFNPSMNLHYLPPIVPSLHHYSCWVNCLDFPQVPLQPIPFKRRRQKWNTCSLQPIDWTNRWVKLLSAKWIFVIERIAGW